MIDKNIMYIWINNNENDEFCHLPKEYQICLMSSVVFNPTYNITIYTNKPLVYDMLLNDKFIKNEIIPEKYMKEIEEIGIKNVAHMSDYIRYNLLYDRGGIYSDTDIIFIRSLDDLLDNGMVLSKEKIHRAICCGVMLSRSNHDLIKSIIEGYKEDYRPDKWTYNSQRPLRTMSKNFSDVKVLEYKDGFFYPNFEDIYDKELYKHCDGIESVEDIGKYFSCRAHHIWSQVSPGRALRKYIESHIENSEDDTYICSLIKYIIKEYNVRMEESKC